MPLVLEVVSTQATRMGVRRRFVVGTNRARIGRTDDNDWVLPSEYVSGRHAEIRCFNDMYFVESCGRTPLLLNEQTRLEKGQQDVLRDGDVLEIDRFRISVRIVDDAAALPALEELPLGVPRDEGGAMSSRRHRDVLDLVPRAAESPRPRPPVPRPPASPADELLSRAAPVASGRRSERDKRQREAFTRLSQGKGKGEGPQERAKGNALTRLSHRTEPATPASLDPADARQTPSSGASSSGLQGVGGDVLIELLREARLDGERVDPRMAAKLRQILRVVVEGTMEVIAARAALKSEFRLRETRIAAEENNPLKLSSNAEEALQNLFLTRNPRCLDAVAAFREAFRDIVAHELAVVLGMKAGYARLIDRFDPRNVEARLEQIGSAAGLAGLAGRKGRLWDLYCAEYESATSEVDRGFGRLFGRAFARAYEAQVERPVDSGTPREAEPEQ